MNTIYEHTLGPLLVRCPWLAFLVLLWPFTWNWQSILCRCAGFFTDTLNRRPQP